MADSKLAAIAEKLAWLVATAKDVLADDMARMYTTGQFGTKLHALGIAVRGMEEAMSGRVTTPPSGFSGGEEP